MPPRQHAILSASSAHRWLNCGPSARLEQDFEDRETEAAAICDGHIVMAYGPPESFLVSYSIFMWIIAVPLIADTVGVVQIESGHGLSLRFGLCFQHG